MKPEGITLYRRRPVMFILPTAECIQFSLSKEVSAATLLGWQIKLMPKGLTWDKLLHPR